MSLKFNVLLLIISFFIITPAFSLAANTHSLYFDGVDDYVSAVDSESLSLTDDFTIELWVKFESFNNSLGVLVSKYGAGNINNERGYWIAYYKNAGLGTTETRISYNGLGNGSAENTTIRTLDHELIENVWYHLVYTYDASEGEIKMYAAEPEDTHTLVGIMSGHHTSIKDSISRFSLASSDGDIDQVFFNGKMDEVRVWNKVRSISEINDSFMRELGGAEFGVVSYWNFNNNLEDQLGLNDFSNHGGSAFDLDVPFVSESEEQNPFPLYTQIESLYPSKTATAEWEKEDYADGVERWCGSTIGGCGCVITSLVMAGRNAGIETDVIEDDVNPKNINEYLKSVGGYTNYGALNWLAASAYLGKFNEDGKLASRFAAAPKRPYGTGTTTLINSSLAEGSNAVLAYNSGHFVWLPEKTENSYLVRDPWWYETVTADDQDTGTYVRDYDNEFTDARIIEIFDEPIEFSGTDIEVHLRGTAELLFKRASGEKVGYEGGNILVDLDRAAYGNTEIISLDGVPVDVETGKHLLVYEAGEEFTIDVVGTGEGKFTLEFFSIDEFGVVTAFEFEGITFPGLATTFTFNLETGEVEEQLIAYDQFLSILDPWLSGLSTQQQKFFRKWAEKVFNDMEEKTVSQAVQTLEVFGKLMIAKKVENPFVMSVLDKLKGSI